MPSLRDVAALRHFGQLLGDLEVEVDCCNFLLFLNHDIKTYNIVLTYARPFDTNTGMPNFTIADAVPFERYVELPGVSASTLKDMLESPRLYLRRQMQPRTDKKSLRLGRAAHTAILQPDRFPLEYAVWKKDAEGQKKRRAGGIWEAFVEANDGRTILDEHEYDQCLSMRDASRQHPIAKQYLDGPGRNELTITWTDADTGLACRARPDRLCAALVDLKTARSVDPSRFGNDATKFGYPLQLAFYREAVRVSDLGDPSVKIVAVQNMEPFDCVVFDIDEDVLGLGEAQFRIAMRRVAECKSSGKWPGMAEDREIALQLPAWASSVTEEPLTMDGVELF